VLARFLCPVPTLASRFYAPRILPDYRPGVAHLGSWFWQQASVSVLYFVFRTCSSVKVRCSCLLRLKWRDFFFFLFKALWCLFVNRLSWKNKNKSKNKIDSSLVLSHFLLGTCRSFSSQCLLHQARRGWLPIFARSVCCIRLVGIVCE
jgi:hypothetical protein